MIVEVDKIFLTKDLHSDYIGDKDHMNTDVIVYLNNGEKYVASFFTFQKIESQRSEYSNTGDFLSGQYFWEKNMVLVEKCDENNIKKLVDHLLDEGDFSSIFQKI